MTAENATSTIAEARTIFRNLPAPCHRMSANRRQTRAAHSVTQGARWRSANAKASAAGVWCRKGRMMKAGMKNHPMAARADTRKISQAPVLREGEYMEME